ncbi:hypothetical protein BDZ97DRAFT_2079218 [Flammula alnicola]|nr:hypothetical protein BDZ97DRAFT_2079218 [Flammula alnicola]
MALSVSGFPEPSRTPGAGSNEVFTGDGAQDGYGKSTLMNSPRLRGLFGVGVSNNGAGKKPPPESSTTSKPDDGLQGAIATATTPPPTSTSSLSFASSFEPLSQQEYELELQLQQPLSMSMPAPRSQISSKRPQLPPLPRKTTASPVRLGPSLTRLDIGAGAWSRSPTTLHSLSNPKPLPPSVVVEEWGPKGADAGSSSASTPQSRPLPSVPGSITDSGKPSSNAVAGPSRSATHPSTSVAGPSRQHVNATASSSKHGTSSSSSKPINAVAGPSKHPTSLVSPNMPMMASSSTSPTALPASKVLIMQPIPQRTHKPNTHSLSMRYQPLVADPSPAPADATSSSSNTNTSNNQHNISSPVRPLPRIPPPPPNTVTAVHKSPLIGTAPPAPSRFDIPPAAKIKRPKTSPGIISGFSTRGGPSSRSPFDNITTTSSSWAAAAARQAADANNNNNNNNNAHRTSSPPLPISSPSPRARSHSRTRRERSVDSYYAAAASRTAPSPSSRVVVVSTVSANANTSGVGPRPPRSLPSPSVAGARQPRKAATLDPFSPGSGNSTTSSKALQIQTANVGLATGITEHSGGAGRIFSPGGRRSQPPSPPTGPVKPRTKASPISSPMAPAVPSVPRIINAQPIPEPPSNRPIQPPTAPTPPPPPAAAAPNPDDDRSTDETQSMDAPLHSHPVDAFADSESLLHPPLSPTTTTAESPVEVFVDDKDMSTASRSPSPIRYARPDSRGNLSDGTNDGDEGGGGGGGDVESSEEEEREREESGMELGRRRRTQLRSYRNSYRPHDGRTSPPHIPYRRSPSPVHEQQHQQQHQQQGIQSTEQEKSEKEKEKKREKKEKKAKKSPRKATRSYFGEYSRSTGGAGLSAAAAGPLSLSVPGTRASSPERKSRSRQPRKLGLADAVSLALDEVRNIGSGGRGTSTSPRRRLKSLVGPPVPFTVAPPVRVLLQEEAEAEGGEVLDISRPISARRDTRDTVGTTDTGSSFSDAAGPPQPSSSARSSIKLGWAKAVGKKRAEAAAAAGEASGSSASGSVAHLSGAGATAALGEMDSAETPYMTGKPPAAPPASFVPPLPHHQHHRRVDSLGQEDRPLLPPSARTHVDSDEGEGERYSIACGLPIGTRSRNPEPPALIASTVSASTRAPSSSSIATSNPAFSSAFGIIGRSGGTKSKKKHTPSASLADGSRAEPTLVIERDLLPMHDGGGGDAGRAWQGDEQTTAGDRVVDEERGDAVVLTTRRVTRTVDPDGDVWEHEQETGVLDVIPHLRNLRVRKS